MSPKISKYAEALLFDTVLRQYEQAWQAGQFDAALQATCAALAAYPEDTRLFWYRCAAMQALGQAQAVVRELEAWQKRCEADNERAMNEDDDIDDADDEIQYQDPAPPSAGELKIFAATLQAMSFETCEWFAWHQLGNEKQELLYNRMIALQPDNANLYADRGQYYFGCAAIYDPDQPVGEDSAVTDLSGTRYLKTLLRKAFDDYKKAASLQPQEPRHFIRMARILHLGKNYDKALQYYDRAIDLVPKDDANRENRIAFLRDMRHASENQGQGERDQMASLITGMVAGERTGKNRSTADDQVYAVLKSMEEAIRAGQTVQETSKTLLSDSPQDILALSVARQIVDIAFEPELRLQEVDLGDFPRFHATHIRKAGRQLKTLGCTHFITAESPTTMELFGLRVPVGIYLSQDKRTSAIILTFPPKWPGTLNFLLMLLTGKWRRKKMVTMSTWLDNNHFVITAQSPEPDHFDWGPNVHKKVILKPISAARQFEQHQKRLQKYLARYAPAQCVSINGMQDIERANRAEVKVRRDYRRSVHYIRSSELKAILGKHYNLLANKITEKVQQLARIKEQEIAREEGRKLQEGT